ncbi:UNVERIFIED_CONTAM: hypothetical protein FKN15_062108 [Acipenser sinensis]
MGTSDKAGSGPAVSGNADSSQACSSRLGTSASRPASGNTGSSQADRGNALDTTGLQVHPPPLFLMPVLIALSALNTPPPVATCVAAAFAAFFGRLAPPDWALLPADLPLATLAVPKLTEEMLWTQQDFRDDFYWLSGDQFNTRRLIGHENTSPPSESTLLKTDISNGDSVTQSQTSVPVKEDENTTIHCQYETTGSLNLFWYIQERNKAPQHMLGLYSSTESRFKERFSASHDKSEKTFNLTLSAAVLSDSATYFCTLSPTLCQSVSYPIQEPRFTLDSPETDGNTACV